MYVYPVLFRRNVFSATRYTEKAFIYSKRRSKRLSENEDILPVTVSERLIDVNSLKRGMNVNVMGQLRSYNHYSSKRTSLY